MKKFELVKDQKIEAFGKTLFRIQALISFADVEAGDIGGYVEKEENLDQSGNAWVSGDARVYGNACVSGNARVYGNAWVYGDAWVSGDARVYGNACVSGDAWVYGNARVYGDAWVYGNACVYGNAWVSGNASVSGDAWVYGDAWVSCNACVYGNARVYGDAWVCRCRDYIQMGPIGSRDDMITFFRSKELKIMVSVGCFFGDIDRFEEKVKNTHGENDHAKAYMLAAQIARLRIDLTPDEENNEQD